MKNIIFGIEKIYIVIAALIVVSMAAVLYWNDNGAFETVTVERGIIYKEIFASGKVRPTEELRLGFQAGGLVSDLYVREGAKVKKGEILAELDVKELLSRLDEALAALSVQNAKLSAAQIQLDNAGSALLTRTRDSYAKIEDATLTRMESFFSSGVFGVSVQEGGSTYNFNTSDLDLRLRMNTERRDIIGLISSWRKQDDPELALERLRRVRDFLDNVALAVSDFSTDKSSLLVILDGYRTSVSTAQSSISSAIISQEAAMQGLLTAQSGVSEAAAEQARAQIETLQTQLRQTRLAAPSDGTILTSPIKAGEVVQSGATVFTFYPADELLVEAEIYEGDVGSVAVGEKARLEFVAFPDKTFEGEVVEIGGAPVLIDGVIHYIAKLRIISPPPQILPSMSVDVLFSLVQKENALVVSEAAIERRDGKAFARVLVGGKIEEREVLLGLRGDGRIVEILDGLREGETAILQ